MVYLRGTSIVVVEPEDKYVESLIKSLNVWDNKAGYPKIKWTAIREVSSEKRSGLVIPRWFPMDRLSSWFRRHDFIIDESFDPVREITFKFKGEARDNLQQGALNFLDDHTNPDNFRQKVLAMRTGKGKTFVAIKRIHQTKVMSIIFCHQKTKIEGWIRDLKKFTDITDDQIAIVDGRASLKRILRDRDQFKIVFAVYRTFSNMLTPKEDDITGEGVKEVQRFFKQMGFGNRTYDEAHLEMKAIFLIDSSTNTKEVVYLTATPKRTENSDDRIYSWMLPRDYHVYGLAERTVADIFADAIFIKINTHPDQETIDSMVGSNGRGLSAAKFSDYVLNVAFDEFYTVMCYYARMAYKKRPNAQIAFTVPKIDLACKLVESFKADFPDKTIGNFTSAVNVDTRHLELEKNIIVTTDKSFTAGEDTRVEVIFNICPITAETTLEQMIGRLRGGEGKKAMFFDICDVGFPKISKQMLIREKYLCGNHVRKAMVVDITGGLDEQS